MNVDTATLHDLDILSTSVARGPTIWSLVDRTRTRVGREALRRRLIAASSGADDILARQHAHRALAKEAHVYQLLLDRAAPDAVERYLNADWQLPAEMNGVVPMVGRVWPAAWFAQYQRDVREGQTRIVALLRAASDMVSRLAESDASVLRDDGQRLAMLTSTRELGMLRDLGVRYSVSAQRRFDQLARGDAKAQLVALLECLGGIEAMWSLGTATAERRWSYPRPGSGLRVTGLVHPFLDEGAVANDLHLDDRVRVCFVTGPNMAGKSTFLKAIAVAVLLAQAGCGVPASAMEFAPVGTIFSSVNIADNVSAGESFYLAEVRRIRALALALRDNGSAVAVIDEPFRGTNVHDATEATLAIVERLAAQPSALVFVASHIGEIAPAIANDQRVRLLHFAADVAHDRPRFDFRLRDGVSTQRLGMTLLKQEQVLELLGGA